MSKKKSVHIYVDGSAKIDTKQYGIGWVRTDHKDRFKAQKSKRLSVHSACSTAAEVYAAQDALDHIRKNVHIVVHSDSKAVVDAISSNSFYDKIRHSTKNKPLRKAWQSLEAAIIKHPNVSAEFTREDDHPRMKQAHNNAKAGAYLKFNEKGYNRRKEKTKTKNQVVESLIDDSNDLVEEYDINSLDSHQIA